MMCFIEESGRVECPLEIAWHNKGYMLFFNLMRSVCYFDIKEATRYFLKTKLLFFLCALFSLLCMYLEPLH